MIIGIDASLRSTALVNIDENKNLLGFEAIKSKPNSEKANKNKPFPELNDEDLIIYNSREVVRFVLNQMDNHIIEGIAIEGLSFAGVSGMKDLIHGNHWGIIVELKKAFPDIPLGKIPVTSWRNSLTTKEERKSGKERYGKKYLKQIVVDKLPHSVKSNFTNYIKINKMDADTLFDLADAYFLAIHRLYLEDENA